MDLWRGVLKAFDGATYTATVEALGFRGLSLAGVLVSRSIPAVELVEGRTVFVLVHDGATPRDAMVVGVH